MSVKINKCIKVTLNKCLNMDMKEIKQIIRDFNYDSCRAANKAMRMWLFHTQDMMEMKLIDKDFNIAKYEKEKYGKSYRNVIEGEMKLLMPLANTSNVGTLHQQLVQNDWGRIKKDVLNYKGQISRYKLDTPYFIKNDNYKLRNHNGYFVDIAFFNKEGLKKYGYKVGHKFEFQIDKIDNNKKATINKLVNGEYKQGSAQISISKKGKIELIISFGFEKDEIVLNCNRILGVDLGITNVLTMAIYDSDSGTYDFIKYNNRVLRGKELINFRQKLYNMGMTNSEIEKEIEKHNKKLHQSQLNKFEVGWISGEDLTKMRNTTELLKKEMSSASKYCGEGRVGHGYKTRMKPVNKVRDKVSNFADTFNHKYSKYVVDFAIKNNCGVIQMEDLSGVTDNTHEKFLKNWSYYDLQNKIMYKAKEHGIEAKKVNPKYTSKRCNKCGCIHEDNRDCEKNQAKFKCVVCGYQDNADINAAKNIAIPNIDKIIDTHIKEIKKIS